MTKQSKADKIRAYLAANPNAKPKDVAEALGVHIAYVYSLTKKKTKVRVLKPVKATYPVATFDKSAAKIAELESSLREAATIIRFYEKRLFQHASL